MKVAVAEPHRIRLIGIVALPILACLRSMSVMPKAETASGFAVVDIVEFFVDVYFTIS